MGFKVTVHKNGAKHGEMHYSSEAVAVGMASKMKNAGAEASVARCNGTGCGCGVKANRRRTSARAASDSLFALETTIRQTEAMLPAAAVRAAREESGWGGSGMVMPTRSEMEAYLRELRRALKANPRRNPGWTEADLIAFLKDRPDGVTVKELVYGFGGTAQAHTKRLAALVTKGVLTHEPWATGGGHYLLAPRTNPRRRNGVTGLSASVDRDDLSGGWAVYIHDGRRTLNMTDDYFASKAGAEREAKKMLAQARAGVPLDTLAAMFYETHHKPFHRHPLMNRRRRNGTTSANAAASRSMTRQFRR